MAGIHRITETEAAGRFWELLDAVENGERFVITREGAPVVEIGPVRRRTGADLSAALEKVEPLDDDFESDVLSVRAFVDGEVRNPWDDV